MHKSLLVLESSNRLLLCASGSIVLEELYYVNVSYPRVSIQHVPIESEKLVDPFPPMKRV